MRLHLIFLASVLLLPMPLLADPVTYYYTGTDFTVLGVNNEPQVYTTSDFVSGEFTVAAPLADGLTTLTTIVPTSFSFTDGYQTITNLTPNLDGSTEFDVETDASGNITGWAIEVDTLTSGVENSIETYNFETTIYDMALFDAYAAPCGSPHCPESYSDGVSLQAAGSWSTTPPTSVTPEPSSFLLLITALPALAVASRRRIRGLQTTMGEWRTALRE